MGVISNIYLLCVYIVIVHYGTVFADKFCFKGVFGEHYECPDETWCCENNRCCSYTDYSNGFYSFMTTALVAFAIVSCCCLLCSCCCRRRQNGVVYGSGTTSTVIQLPPQSVPQGYPGYPPAQSPYPANPAAYNPYYAAPPPDYQTTMATSVSSPNVMPIIPVASAPPPAAI